ncbi:chemotaxis protein CheX [Humisphaera borealis]|uniref:Chemotaxis protein CheX n=1 Tax=Humisphaera borealis TaxID=2807512 RepID=A0A7M2WRD5_9BACT|nr:chemotaxis protein CheX [Humisphaera borealis]QOV88115.1 chemotaxis protein CheX [Humisphaera borealis]
MDTNDTAIAESTSTPEITSDQVEQLVAGVWDQTLRMPVATGDSGGSVAASERQMAAYVQISGAWDGTVALHCTHDLAAAAAASMFNVPLASVTSRDELDALGELANMIGGNLKPLFPGPSHLSLPTVIGGVSYAARVPGSRVIGRHHFESGGHPFSVAVMEREKSRAVHTNR